MLGWSDSSFDENLEVLAAEVSLSIPSTSIQNYEQWYLPAIPPLLVAEEPMEIFWLTI